MKNRLKMGTRLIIMMLMVSMLLSSTAYAAVTKVPTLSKKNITLYVNNQNHKIKINNLEKKAKVSYVSSNEKVVKVLSKGYIKAVAKGKATIKIQVMQNNKSYKLSMAVVVKTPSLQITKSIKSIESTESYSFKAKAQGLKNPELIWKSSDPTVGSIDSKTGLFTANRAGNTQITVYDRTSKKKATSKVEVYSFPERTSFEYIIENEEVIIQGFNGSSKDIVIPDELDGFPVTKISSWAFNQSQIESVVMGNNIHTIGAYAFFCATELKKAVLAEGVITLEEHCFDGCSSLIEMNIPDTVKKIGGYAFDGCSSLYKLQVNNSIKREFGENIFNNVALSNPIIASINNVRFHLKEHDLEIIKMAEDALADMNILDADPDVEKVKKVHDWIIHHMMWEKEINDIIKIQDATGASDIEIALKYHIGVCEHYMVAFETFMNMLEIKNKRVYNINGTHVWNMVQLDGDWYMLDVGYDGPNGYLLYENFLFNSKDSFVEWREAHGYDESKYPLVNGTKYSNYVNRTFNTPITEAYPDDLAAEFR